eukprot:TRINITY_DN10208_c0_g1_i1.p1 TRINITY_DN10208_c0_g1~~TRINITY_DN10208_c0_g1_i1.p1  ORF type:complete len:402 (-),score=111.57 TRINITY_DN10208_c0_g1_i1:125-1303(-)
MFVHLLFFVALATATLAPLNQVSSPVAGEYIVVYKDEVHTDLLQKELAHAVENFEVLHQYAHVLSGYSARLTDEQLASVRANPLVKYVEVNAEVHAIGNVECTKELAYSWGLNRISEEKMNLDGFYSYPTSAGKDVDVYVIDTGIYIDNYDFEGRATFGFKAKSSWSSTDANGHGTHVASTSIGKVYGVAKAATAIAVKVLGDDGSGDNAGVLAGIDYAIERAVYSKKRSVINMSLGGGYSSALNAAVNAATASGMVVVVAAGNEDSDACDTSPSSATDVITVGATDIGANNKDIRAYYSNWGSCVNVFAPGSDITAAWIGGTTATNTISGTSMASPHVAGLAALYWGESPDALNTEIAAQIVGDATPNLIDFLCATSACKKSPNLIVFNGC